MRKLFFIQMVIRYYATGFVKLRILRFRTISNFYLSYFNTH